jgi:hypothetical protein
MSLTGGNSSCSDFAMNIFSLGLEKSYNSYNRKFSFPGKANGDIGGVATNAGIFKNILNSDY